MEGLLKILKSYDYAYTNNLETFKAEAERHGVPLKYLMQYAFTSLIEDYERFGLSGHMLHVTRCHILEVTAAYYNTKC